MLGVLRGGPPPPPLRSPSAGNGKGRENEGHRLAACRNRSAQLRFDFSFSQGAHLIVHASHSESSVRCDPPPSLDCRDRPSSLLASPRHGRPLLKFVRLLGFALFPARCTLRRTLPGWTCEPLRLPSAVRKRSSVVPACACMCGFPRLLFWRSDPCASPRLRRRGCCCALALARAPFRELLLSHSGMMRIRTDTCVTSGFLDGVT